MDSTSILSQPPPVASKVTQQLTPMLWFEDPTRPGDIYRQRPFYLLACGHVVAPPLPHWTQQVARPLYLHCGQCSARPLETLAGLASNPEKRIE